MRKRQTAKEAPSIYGCMPSQQTDGNFVLPASLAIQARANLQKQQKPITQKRILQCPSAFMHSPAYGSRRN